MKESQNDCDQLLRLVKERGTPITVRLVKGAYWDYETVKSKEAGLPCPVFSCKAATDLNYESLSVRLLKNHDLIHPAFGSHNLRSLIHAIIKAEKLGLAKNAFEIQMLYGMAEPERKVFSELGHRVRVYAPVGDMIPGMAYLVRRLLENSSNQGFLKLSFHDHADIDDMMLAPTAAADSDYDAGVSEFKNCSPLDFNQENIRLNFSEAIVQVSETLPVTIPGSGSETLTRQNPSDLDQTVFRVQMAGIEDADRAVDTIRKAWPKWRNNTLNDRCGLLEKLADRLATDRVRLAAIQCFE